MTKATRLVTRAFTQTLDRGITLNLLKCFRHFAQAAARIACAVVSVLGILLFGTAEAAAPTFARQIVITEYTPQMYAKAQLSKTEYKCLWQLYYYESRWDSNARNGSMYGIPQGNSIYLKTASPIAQVKWGIKYNQNRHKTMCNALDHFNDKGWH
jgi:hypothetical protein